MRVRFILCTATFCGLVGALVRPPAGNAGAERIPAAGPGPEAPAKQETADQREEAGEAERGIATESPEAKEPVEEDV